LDEGGKDIVLYVLNASTNTSCEAAFTCKDILVVKCEYQASINVTKYISENVRDAVENNSFTTVNVTKYADKINSLGNSTSEQVDAIGINISFGVAAIAGIQIGLDLIKINNTTSTEDKGEFNAYFTWGVGLGVGGGPVVTYSNYAFNKAHPEAENGLTGKIFEGPSFATSVGYVATYTQGASYGENPSNNCLFGCNDDPLYTFKGSGYGIGLSRMSLNSYKMATLFEVNKSNSNPTNDNSSEYDPTFVK